MTATPKGSGGEQPSEEAAAGSGVRARGVDIVVHGLAVNRPSATPAEPVEGDAMRSAAASGTLAQAMARP